MKLKNAGTTIMSFVFDAVLIKLAPDETFDIDDRRMSEGINLANGFPDLVVVPPSGTVNPEDFALANHNHAGTYSSYYHTHVNAGTWAQRPSTNLSDGKMFFCTEDHKPYWYEDSGTKSKWFDATGVERDE